LMRARYQGHKNVRAQVIFISKQFENQKKFFRIQINLFQKIRR